MSRPEKILVSRAGTEAEPSLASIFGAGPTLLDSPDAHDLALEIEPPTRPIGDFGFQGTFVSEDVVLPGSLQIEEHKVTLWTSGTQLASWRILECKVERADDNQFSIEAEGETITFTPDDPEGLSAAIAVFMTPSTSPSVGEKVVKGRKPRTPSGTNGKPKAKARSRPKSEAQAPEMTASDTTEPETTAFETSASDAGATFPPELSEPTDSESPVSPPTATAARSPAISRPRIKAFVPKTMEGDEQVWPVAGRSTGEDGVAVAIPGPDGPEMEANQGTVADRITANAIRQFRSAKAHRWLKGDLQAMAIKAGVVAAVIGLVSLFAATIIILTGGFSEDAKPIALPTSTLPPPPTTSSAPATTAPPPPITLFQAGAGELTERWNGLAEASRQELTLFTELTSPFVVSLTPYITFEGLLDPAVGSVVIRATPTGTPEGDGLILTSLGLLIGVADPTLDGSDRRALLESLGLAIESPELAGLDGTINHNGLTYHLAYALDQNLIQFTITPEGVAVPTTTPTP